MTINQLLGILYPPGSLKILTQDQRSIVHHPGGPGWVLAGPGSGKTEVLAATVLRLLYVQGDPVQQSRVRPESIFVTTFTDKAARNLEDRILNYRAQVVAADPSLAAVDVSKLRIGTLHGLANDVLQEFRAPNYQNVRLMDEFEQALFVREHMSLIKTPNATAEIAFWQTFPWLFTPQEWQPTRAYAPSRWNSTHALVILLNRIVEDRVSVASLRAARGQLVRLADLYDEYFQRLQTNYRCDFSHLQGRFFEFLGAPLGQSFLNGDSTPANPGIQWVLVDEYQDTNPMQEEIYFRLASRAQHNLLVVGDDDQAMYRFRGGSVECMVTFDQACQVFFGISPANVTRYSLVDNFRSHKEIVTFFNNFITAFPLMGTAGARSPKSPIVARKTIPQTYPAVGRIVGRTQDDVARLFAQTVAELISTGRVNDANECCLLLKSTKESPRNAGPYVAALDAEDLPVYNPRNKTFMEQEEVQGLLGAILAVVDPQRRYAQDPANANAIPAAEGDFRAAYTALANAHPDLALYVQHCRAAVLARPGLPFDCNLQELAYYLISREPFSTWQNDPSRRVRLGRITKLLEAYSSTPVLDPATGLPRPNVTRGFMRGSPGFPGEVVGPWLHSFYHLFLTYVVDIGMNDDEDDEVICPPGMVPVMTMHQSKGLEFPFVFVGHMGENAKVGPSHHLETMFSNYPANPARSFPKRPERERAEMDLIRQFYVAYSRAEYALVFLGTTTQFNKATVPLRTGCRMAAAQDNSPMSAATVFPTGLVAPHPPTLLRPRFSLTSDIISFRRCRRQYGYFGNDGFVPAQAVQVYFGQMIHQVLDRCHRHFSGFFGHPQGTFPVDGDIDTYFAEVDRAMRAHGIRPASPRVADQAKEVLKTFNSVEGPTLYPRVLDTEYRLESERVSYILRGVVDVLASDSSGETEIWDYKGTDMPPLSSPSLQDYEWQMSVYAQLYKVKAGHYPRRAVLYFLNELKPKPGQPPITTRPLPAVHVVDFMRAGVEADGTPTLVRQGLSAFDVTANQIIICKQAQTWQAPSGTDVPDDKTCDICDIRWNCGAHPSGKYPMRMPV